MIVCVISAIQYLRNILKKYNREVYIMWAFIENAIVAIAKRLGLSLVRKPVLTDNYSNYQTISLTAVIANRLSTITLSDSTIQVKGGNARARYISSYVENVLMPKLNEACEVSLGTGDVLLKPFTDGKVIGLSIIRNEHFYICDCVGDYIKACIVKCDEVTKTNGVKYERYETQRVGKATDIYGNEIDVLFIYEQAFCNGKEVALSTIPEWSTIEPFMYIPNCNHVLFGRIKCPTVNRNDVNGVNGVPITYGLDDVMSKAVESYYRYNKEYEIKESAIFADKTVFTKNKQTGELEMPLLKETRGKKVFMLCNRNSDNNTSVSDLVQSFSPEIRSAAMSESITTNFKMLEMLCGLSSGILSEPTTNFATATEMKASLSATYAYCTRFRRNIEAGVNELLSAINVLCNYNDITPIGTYNVTYDWSSSYIENYNEQYERLLKGYDVGIVSKEELRSWLMDEPIDVAKANMPTDLRGNDLDSK